MKYFLTILTVALLAGAASAQNTMVITFKDGKTLNLDTNAILKIEYQQGHVSGHPSTSPQPDCWTGRYAGNDISGYGMDININESFGKVTGGYTYYHKGQQKYVTAVIDGVVEGNAIKGRWRQVSGIVAEGNFVWRWLAGKECSAFEGSFDGTKYWQRMTKQ